MKFLSAFITTNGRKFKYITPDGTKSAPYAGFWRRLAGSLVDWAICFAVLILGANLLAAFSGDGSAGPEGGAAVHETSVGDLWWIPIVAALFVAYFAFFGARGQSLGMKAVGIRIVDLATGRPPRVGRATAKACLTVMFGFAAFLLLSSVFSDPGPQGLNAVDLAVLYLLAALLVTGFLGWFWMIWDARKQTLQDKVAGVLVVGKMVAVGGEAAETKD